VTKGRKDTRYEKWRWTIFGLTWIAYVGFYFTRKAFPVAKVGILADPAFDMGKSAMGVVDGAYGVAYAIGQFVWGFAGDRFGSRRIVLGGMLCSVVFSVGMGLSTHVILFGFLFFLQGLCQSTGWAPLAKNLSEWFSKNERGRIFGFWSTNYVVGGMAGSALAGYVALRFGDWRLAFLSSAGVLLIIFIVLFLFQKNRPEDIGLPPIEDYHGEGTTALPDEKPVSAEPGKSGVKITAVFLDPMILRLGMAYFLLKPTRYAILFWGPVMAYDRLGTNIGKSALISAAFEASGPISAVCAGWASDRLFQSRRMPVVVPSLFGLSLVLFLFPTLTEYGGAWAMAVAFFAIGLLLHAPETLLSGAAAVDFGTRKGAGSAVGFVNGSGSVGQILGMSLPGVISTAFGWGVLFTTFGLTALIGALILLPKWNAVPAVNDRDDEGDSNRGTSRESPSKVS
jgi:OPA family sugar phosphate sensor protein UhpC-like MFS transporter